jgi:hypothetical protein
VFVGPPAWQNPSCNGNLVSVDRSIELRTNHSGPYPRLWSIISGCRLDCIVCLRLGSISRCIPAFCKSAQEAVSSVPSKLSADQSLLIPNSEMFRAHLDSLLLLLKALRLNNFFMPGILAEDDMTDWRDIMEIEAASV